MEKENEKFLIGRRTEAWERLAPRRDPFPKPTLQQVDSPADPPCCRSSQPGMHKLFIHLSIVSQLLIANNITSWAAIAQSVHRHGTAWLDGPGIDSRWGEIFRTRPDRPRDPPRLLYNRKRVSFRWEKRPRRGVNHPPHLKSRLKKQ